MKSLSFVIGLVLLSMGCDDPSVPAAPVVLSPAQLELHYDEQKPFILTQGSRSVPAQGYSWTSANPVVGTIDAQAVFKGNRIGQTTITGVSMDKKTQVTANVTVVPYSMLCKEPFVGFGSVKSAVKEKETRQADGAETDWTLLYRGENAKVNYVVYHFEAGRMTSGTLMLSGTSEVRKEAEVFLKERYASVTSQNGVSLFTDSSTVLIGMKQDVAIGLVIVYMPYTPGNVTEQLAQFEKELSRIKN